MFPIKPPGCISLLGLEGGGIAESQISSSSVRYTVLGLQRWGPELARLHNKGLVNAWSAAVHDRNPWIEVSGVWPARHERALRCTSLISALFQINVQRKMRFTGIVTQGASRMATAEFIKAFKVASSLDGRTYAVYRTEGERRDHVRRLRSTKTGAWAVPAQQPRLNSLLCPDSAGVRGKRGQRRHQDQPVRPPHRRPVPPRGPGGVSQGVHAAHGAGGLRAQRYTRTGSDIMKQSLLGPNSPGFLEFTPHMCRDLIPGSKVEVTTGDFVKISAPQHSLITKHICSCLKECNFGRQILEKSSIQWM